MKNLIVPKYLLDTNVVIESFWGKQPTADLVKSWIREGEIALSAITIAEIFSKASQLEREKLKLLISRFGVLPIDEVIAEIAGNYRQKFLVKKKRVYLLDCLIAATAKLYNLQLVTRNTKDYPMKDIKVVDPSCVKNKNRNCIDDPGLTSSTVRGVQAQPDHLGGVFSKKISSPVIK